MASPLLSSQRLLLLITAALILNSQLPSSIASLAGNVLAPVVNFASLPLRGPVYSTATKIAEREDSSDFAHPGVPKTEDELRRAYGLALVEIERLKQEYQELKQRLELIEGVQAIDAPETRPLTAKVTGYRNPGPRQVITLNRGSRQGIQPGMTVVYETVLVGRVVDPVGPSSADVELVTSHDGGLQVRINQPGLVAPEENIRVRRSENDPDYFVAEVPKDSLLRAGAVVVLADAVNYSDARGRLLGIVERKAPYTPDPELLDQLWIRAAVLDTPYRKEVAVLLPKADEDAPGN
ncbi:rod shape-determining protein MreC [Algisphaera agarilytica]|uniref:Cell shape-determining protein MreC n=1 Tax=Algisphaera agarilytica TaxID=1385975 RepID=A0A7X0H8T9_9BACT|nr:rod shape-determining protein MreC [Algisphaera agarilytica]MBB6431404.1 cell shape-determining protein MreC [Algisphaera agarilytica]